MKKDDMCISTNRKKGEMKTMEKQRKGEPMNKIISLENYRKKRNDEVFAAVNGAENFYWYSTDIRGSSSSILKSDSTASHGVKRVRDFSYDAYGNTTDTLQNTTDTEMDEIAYTGGVFDKELGLYYLMSRYYDPAIAQFI